jgi:hypothetical protein
MGVRSTVDVTRQEAIYRIACLTEDLEEKTNEEIADILNSLTENTCDNFRIVEGTD